MRDVALLIISLGIILIGAEGFTNAVEWLGHKLHLGAGAVGSILAAVGTALPETMIPIIAFLGGGKGNEVAEVGIGAILGAPLMLATLAFFVSGAAVLLFRHHNHPLLIDENVVERDLAYFLIVYSLAVLASFFPFPQFKSIIAVFLLVCYLWYVIRTLRYNRDQSGHGELAALYLARRSGQVHNPGFLAILGQIALALLAIVLGARIFVSAVQSVALVIGVPALVLSLIITPIATELPEKFNSVLWLRQGKDTLAIGNITGAMVFQSSVIPALGIVLTPWHLDALAMWSAFLALAAAAVPYLSLKINGFVKPSSLLVGGGFYLLFIMSVLRFPLSP